MKKQLFNLRALLMLCMIFVIGGGSVAFAEEVTVTSTFTNNKWAVNAGEPTWTKTGADANSFESASPSRGVQTTLKDIKSSGLSLTNSTIKELGNITSVSLIVSSTGTGGSISSVKVGETNLMCGTSTSYTVGKSNNQTATFTTSENVKGDIVITFASTATSKTLYVKSISVTYSTGSTTTATLTDISVTGDAADLWTGDNFTHEGITVTAKYDDNSEKDVTNSCTYSGYDMSTAGSQTVTVSYGEKTASYTVNVKTIGNTKETAYTASKAIELIDAGKGLKTPVYVKGKVSKIATAWTKSNGYLSFWVSEDGTENKFEMYKNYKGADNEKYASVDECPEKGDDVICCGQLTKYNTTYELNAGNYLVEKTTVEDNRTTTTVTFGSGVDDQTFGVNLGETFEGKTATVSPAEAGNVTYKSDNTDVASVNESTGAITIGNTAGTATITASFTATDTYKASSAKYYINVVDPNGPVFYESFNQNDGTGGNDETWNGINTTPTLQYDESGWTVEKGYGAKQCARFGTGKAQGSATTPTIDLSGDKYIHTYVQSWSMGRNG